MSPKRLELRGGRDVIQEVRLTEYDFCFVFSYQKL